MLILLRVVYWILAPIAALGVQAIRFRNWADETIRIAKAVKPGTPVSLTCKCHEHALWYVEKYDADANDYRLVSVWPAPPLFGRRNEIDSMYVRRDRFRVVEPWKPSLEDRVENMVG